MEGTYDMKPTQITMAFGTIVLLACIVAWLWGETHGVKTDILWVVAVPIIGVLFIGQQLNSVASHAQQAANQTNGQLEPRIKAAVAAALADRDAARTRQVQGDIGESGASYRDLREAENARNQPEVFPS